jgi:hypothetical protein
MEQGIVGRPVRKNDYLQIAKLRMIGEAYRDTSGVMVDERPVFRSKSRRSLVRESARIYREMHSRPESSFMLLTFVNRWIPGRLLLRAFVRDCGASRASTTRNSY